MTRRQRRRPQPPENATDGERFVSPVIAAMPPSGIRRFFDLVTNARDILSLGVGEPDFHTPWHIREAAIYALERGRTTYTANAGLYSLRRAVAEYLEQTRGVSYNPDSEVLITVGVSEAIDLVLRAVLRPGDEVLIPEPCFVSYAPCATFAGGRPVPVPTYLSDGFQPAQAALEAALSPRTRAILFGTPNNPTGAVLGEESLAAIAALARQHDLLVISDEIYSDLVFAPPFRSPASLPGMSERTVILHGFSKAYAMTGWRVGYAAGPRAIVQAMCKIHQYTLMCAPTNAQEAALEALRHGAAERERMRVEYDRRRRLVMRSLAQIGLPCLDPQGAFYTFPDIRSTGLDSESFAAELLREKRVAVVPGNAFGQTGEGFVRCSYAVSLDHLGEALRRLEEFVRERARRAPSMAQGLRQVR